MRRRIFYFIFILFLCLLVGYFFGWFSEKPAFSIPDSSPEGPSASNVIIQTEENQDSAPKKITKEKSAALTQKIEQSVPFIVQAPFANWSDTNFQNACEEASMVMAMGWIKGEKTISREEAQKRILELIDFENQNLGYSLDTDAADIEKIFREYFQHTDVEARENITLSDLKTELQKGRLVIVPAFGQALGNPNFTQPGPVAHMLVLIGYDPKTREFITNDPGTRKGAGYRYDEDVLFAAIWAYPSGPTNPPLPTNERLKTMISVGK